MLTDTAAECDDVDAAKHGDVSADVLPDAITIKLDRELRLGAFRSKESLHVPAQSRQSEQPRFHVEHVLEPLGSEPGRALKEGDETAIDVSRTG